MSAPQETIIIIKSHCQRKLHISSGEPGKNASRDQVCEASLSRRFWRPRRSGRLSRYRWCQFNLSNNRAFALKLYDAIGLCVAPPAHAVVPSVDEKSQIQVLDLIQWCCCVEGAEVGLPPFPAASGGLDAHGHTDGGGAVDASDGQRGLNLLAVEGAGLQAGSDHRLVAAHRRLGERASVITDLLLPGLAADLCTASYGGAAGELRGLDPRRQPCAAGLRGSIPRRTAVLGARGWRGGCRNCHPTLFTGVF